MREEKEDVIKAVLLRNCQSNSVLAGPFASGCFVPWAIGLVDMCDLGHKRIVRVGVCEHRADRKEHYFANIG